MAKKKAIPYKTNPVSRDGVSVQLFPKQDITPYEALVVACVVQARLSIPRLAERIRELGVERHFVITEDA